MNGDLSTILTILGMAAATYLTRASGLLILSRVRVTPRLEAFLRHMPGAILVSIVVPGLASGGPAEWCSGVVVAVVAALTRNLILAMIVGVGLVAGLRALLG